MAIIILYLTIPSYARFPLENICIENKYNSRDRDKINQVIDIHRYYQK